MKKYLIFRTDRVGDFLLTLSLIKILKNKKKRDTPPKTLSKINPEGLIYSGITSLAIE